LIPYLAAIDQAFSKRPVCVRTGRWDYWTRTFEAGKVLDEPIPQIDWLSIGHDEPRKNLEKCVKLCDNRFSRNALDLFVDWLLHAFGDQSVKELPKDLEPRLNAGWYKTFNLGPYLQHPYDYLGDYAAELYGSGKSNPTGYFPTPMNISVMMAKMTMSKKDKTASVCDPCVGSGRLLMAASNYSLNLYGMDIDPSILKICKVNMWQYVPWGVYRPDNIKGLEAVRHPMQQGDSLAIQPITQTTKETQEKLLEGVQLELF